MTKHTSLKERFLSIYAKDILKESPLLRLKSDIWSKILLNLPLTEVGKLNEVSWKMKLIVDNSDYWIKTAQLAKVQIQGIRQKKDPKHYVATSYRTLLKQQYVGRICDNCFTGKKFADRRMSAVGVLPVRLHTNPNVINHLCRDCRNIYYEKYPEPPLDSVDMTNIVEGQELMELKNQLDITKQEVRTLRSTLEQNGKRKLTRGDLYLEARKKHGGDVGIEAQKRYRGM
ncbi:hypothetical protein BJ944DRAFT_269178 [Cunninghamella echinulata]|nr:hypothetical protein BJ944DRAFT_269178 [Cunninghamella echinulata]